MQSLGEAADKEYFDQLLERFEYVWENSFKNKSISKSAAFSAFTEVVSTRALMDFFMDQEEAENLDEGDEWKTKQ